MSTVLEQPRMLPSTGPIGGPLPRASRQPASPFQTPGATLTPYGPGNDLRGTSILPSDSRRTTAASGAADQAYGAYAGNALPTWNTVGPYQSQNSMRGIAPLSSNAVAGPDFTGARGALTSALPRASQYGAAAMAGTEGIGSAPSVSFDGSVASGTYGQAAGAVGGPFAYAGDTGDVRSQLVGRVSNLTTPDRQKLAEESLALLEARSQPQFDQALRTVGQKAAALGRIGSGVTTNELGDVTMGRERELSLARRELANQTAGLRLQDELDQVGATQGVFNTVSGADRDGYGLNLQRASTLADIASGQKGLADSAMQASSENARNSLTGQGLRLERASLVRGLGQDEWGRATDTAGLETGWARDTYGANRDNEDRRVDVGKFNTNQAADAVRFDEDRDRYGYQSRVTERDRGFQAGMDRDTQLGARADRLGTREDQMRTYDARNRDELRGERGFQNDQARQAQQDRIAMQQFYQWLQSQQYGNATSLFGAGQTGNVGGALGQEAAQAGNNAAGWWDTAGQIGSSIPALRRRSAATDDPAYRMAGGGTLA